MIPAVSNQGGDDQPPGKESAHLLRPDQRAPARADPSQHEPASVRAESDSQHRKRRLLHYGSLGCQGEDGMDYTNSVADKNDDPQNIHRADSGMSFQLSNITCRS